MVCNIGNLIHASTLPEHCTFLCSYFLLHVRQYKYTYSYRLHDGGRFNDRNMS